MIYSRGIQGLYKGYVNRQCIGQSSLGSNVKAPT